MIIKKNRILAIISFGLLFIYSTHMTFALTIQDSIISGIIWDDENENGVQELSEPSITGVKVYLQHQTTDELFTTETGAGGEFAFLDLEVGQYQLWYEHDEIPSEIFELNLDELNGIASLNIPISLDTDGSVEVANIGDYHTLYLPIIIR